MRCRRNYYIFILISLLQGCCFYAPVATLYRLEYGVPLSQLFIIESISWVLCIGLELPMGRFADRFGHRRTVVLGCFTLFASKIVFAFASGFALFMLERVLLAIADAAISGALESLLYDSVGPDRAESRFAAYNAAGTLGLLAASMLSPLLYRVSMRNAAYATVLSYGLAALLCLFLKEPAAVEAGRSIAAAVPAGPGGQSSGDSADAAPLQAGQTPGIRAALRRLGSDRKLLRLLLALAVSGEFAQASTVFLSQPQYKRAGIPESRYGLLFALIQCAALGGAAAAGLANRGKTQAEHRGRMRIAVLGAAAALECGSCVCLAFWPTPLLSAAALFVFSAAAAAQRPLSSVIQVERSPEGSRATSLSLNAMLAELVSAAMNPLEGAVAGSSLKLGFCAFALPLFLIALLSPWFFAAAGESPDNEKRCSAGS